MTDLTKPESSHPIDTVNYAAVERRTAVLEVIRSAKKELAISLFAAMISPFWTPWRMR